MDVRDRPICGLCRRHPVVMDDDIWCDRCTIIAEDTKADSHDEGSADV